MGQKRQLERRRAELERQASTMDARSLRQQLARSHAPRAVKAQLLALLSRPGEPDGDVLAITAEAAGAFRREGALDDAAKLLELAGPRTRALRVEAGLLAFCRGEDASLRENAHPDVVAALGALVALAKGERPRPPAPGSPAGVVALAGLARMVSAAEHGDRPGVARAAKEVPEDLRPRLFYDVLHAASSLATLGARETGASGFAKMLSESSLVRGDASRERALGALLADAAPTAVDRGAVRAGAAARQASERRKAAAIVARRDDAADPMAAAMHVAHEVGESAFANAGDGALLVGFDRLADGDCTQALDRFDAAIAAGADLVEALRGRWLALKGIEGRASARAQRPTDEAAYAAETLARALHGRPGAAPYAVLAATAAARSFAVAGFPSGVARAEALARGYALPGALPPAILAELEVHHLRGRLARPDEAAQRRLVELTKSMPELVEAWRLRLDHAAQTDATDDEIDGLALEAFAKTRSHVFEHAAGHAERRRARSAPPSPAAALVRDVVRRLEESPNAVVSPDGRLDAALEAQLAELAPTARHAARAAIIVELGIASRWPELRAFFGRVAREATKAELGELFFAFAFIPDDAADRPLAGQIQALSTSGLASPEALRDAFDGALAGRHRQAASAAVVALAPHVRSSELTRLRKLLGTIHGAQPPRQAIDRWDDVLDRMHAELQPGYSLESAVYGDDVDDGPGDHDEGDDGSPFADMTAQVDEALRRASPAERARLLRELSKIVAGKAVPAEGDLARIAQLVASMNAPGKRQTQ